MKKLFTVLIAIAFTLSATAQEQGRYNIVKNDDGTFSYMRSSLEMVYIKTDFPSLNENQKRYLDNAWNDYMNPEKAFPNQYNKHDAGINSVTLTGNQDISDGQLTTLLNGYIKENKIANQMLQKWFQYNPNASKDFDYDNPTDPDAPFNMSVIYERGLYNDNSGQENVVSQSLKRDRETMAKDLGIKLIPFTFLTFTKLNFYKNEPVAAAVRDAAIAVAASYYNDAIKNGKDQNNARLVYDISVTIAQAAYAATKDGYTLASTTWLYRLKWDEATEAYFNNQVFNNPKLIETSDRFQMEFIDCQTNSSIVLFSVGKTEERIINLTVTRDLNNIFEKLQRRNDVFKVWTPVLDYYSLAGSRYIEVPITVEKGVITAKIGTAEGLRGGEGFVVLDRDGKLISKKPVIAKNGFVWDNAVLGGADDKILYETQKDKKGRLVTATTFKGKVKGAETGMTLAGPTQAPKKTRISAKIGTKESVSPRDVFDVFQYDEPTGKLIKVGSVKPVKGKIWDNQYYGSSKEIQTETKGTLKKRDKEGLRQMETVFKGISDVQPGMFLRRAR